jgi:hypothetical protein
LSKSTTLYCSIPSPLRCAHASFAKITGLKSYRRCLASIQGDGGGRHASFLCRYMDVREQALGTTQQARAPIWQMVTMTMPSCSSHSLQTHKIGHKTRNIVMKPAGIHSRSGRPTGLLKMHLDRWQV